MQLSTVILSVASIVAFSAPALATDYRQLVNFPGGDATTFCNSWRCDCINYTPTSKDLVSFQGAVCEPGDYHGQNMNSQAKVFCVWSKSDGTLQSLFKHISAETGATLA